MEGRRAKTQRGSTSCSSRKPERATGPAALTSHGSKTSRVYVRVRRPTLAARGAAQQQACRRRWDAIARFARKQWRPNVPAAQPPLGALAQSARNRAQQAAAVHAGAGGPTPPPRGRRAAGTLCEIPSPVYFEDKEEERNQF